MFPRLIKDTLSFLSLGLLFFYALAQSPHHWGVTHFICLCLCVLYWLRIGDYYINRSSQNVWCWKKSSLENEDWVHRGWRSAEPVGNRLVCCISNRNAITKLVGGKNVPNPLKWTAQRIRHGRQWTQVWSSHSLGLGVTIDALLIVRLGLHWRNFGKCAC